jgi:hypothetical protein
MEGRNEEARDEEDEVQGIAGEIGLGPVFQLASVSRAFDYHRINNYDHTRLPSAWRSRFCLPRAVRGWRLAVYGGANGGGQGRGGWGAGG